MRIAFYGGCFNPPHLGHLAAVKEAYEALQPDRFLILPDRQPPHKKAIPGEPGPEERLELCRKAFGCFDWAEVSDLSFSREGPCYMADTVRLLRQQYPGDDLILVLGADMLPGIEDWHDAASLLNDLHLAILDRDEIPRSTLEEVSSRLHQRFGARVDFIPNDPVAISSSQVRALLPQRKGEDLLPASVYREIIRRRWYGAQVSLPWLRDQVYAMLKPSRIHHVAGCEKAAAALAARWGADPEIAAEAGILHDMTKRWTAEEQYRFCREQGIELDACEMESPQLLHAKTGAREAKLRFGASDEICQAIRWHTTGKPEMSLLEKILYLADVIEENRNYQGVDELRRLCFEDLDEAMAYATRSSLEHVRESGNQIHHDTLDAYRWYSAADNRRRNSNVISR